MWQTCWGAGLVSLILACPGLLATAREDLWAFSVTLACGWQRRCRSDVLTAAADQAPAFRTVPCTSRSDLHHAWLKCPTSNFTPTSYSRKAAPSGTSLPVASRSSSTCTSALTTQPPNAGGHIEVVSVNVRPYIGVYGGINMLVWNVQAAHAAPPALANTAT